MGLRETLIQGRYLAYSYAYPHKTAYRPFAEPIPLQTLWKDEDQSALFLYVHIPFCEMRCGFCNLFTMAKPKVEFERDYLKVLRRQAELTREALPDAKFARIAIGGGTPTHLDEAGLEAVFSIVRDVMGADALAVPASVEMSPETLTPSKARMLREFGIDRASIGVQSFLESETKAVRRPQQADVARGALDMMRSAGFPTMNIDLIYGIQDQTPETFEYSIREALKFEPEEIYLYPLYVRPLTGLGNSPRAWEDVRFALYLHGSQVLLDSGYEQVSMRMFRKIAAGSDTGPVYCCQADGTVGLGAGARSYTSTTHYCSEYAVGRRGVVDILEDFVQRPDTRLSHVEYGTPMNSEEQRRRFMILSLLSSEGLSDVGYAAKFKAQPMDDFPELVELLEMNLATKQDNLLILTREGMGWSDAIGPWLYSESVRQSCDEFELR